jgi:AcrR family transcriptional regulator
MTTRDPFKAPPVKSRRGGPTKEPLSRDAIVAEALRLITQDGLSGMSLRKVAAALQTGPASLYAYVSDLDELHALVLDRALAGVALPGADGDWHARTHQLLGAYAQVLIASPGLAQLAFNTVAVGPNALRITETLLALLDESGIGRASSAWAVDLLLLYVTAVVAEHADGAEPAAPGGPISKAITQASPLALPRIHAARDELLSGTGEQRFTWAIDVILQGILHSPPPPTSPEATMA